MQTIDLTKIQPTSPSYIGYLILAVIVILACIGLGTWIYTSIKKVAAPVTSMVTDLI